MTVSPLFPVAERANPEGDVKAAREEVYDHLRTQFLRRVAHDIASPTGVTMTVLDELAQEADTRPELLAMARRSLRRLMRLSEHLALAAELESGSLIPELARTDARAIAKQALDEALAIDGRKDVVASCELPPDVVPVDGDTRLLAFAVRETIGNALKLASSQVHVSVIRDGGRAVVRVEDDGPGFSDEAKALLGRRFVRKNAARGLGLSLSMATDILRAHSGTLTLSESALPPGKRGTAGAAVVVSLPSDSTSA